VELKNKVILEQERLVNLLETEQEEKLRLETALAGEQAKVIELRTQMESLKRTLEHNQSVLEDNQTLISYLQQHHHRSY